MKNKLFRIAFFSVVIAFVAACSSSRTTVESDLFISGAPDWVNAGTQEVNNDSGRLLHGVGMSAVINDESLQKSVADNRARAEVARIMSISIEAMMGDHTTANDGAVSATVDREIKSQTQLALKGAKVVGRWKNRDNGDIYSLVEVDLDDLEAAVERANSLTKTAL